MNIRHGFILSAILNAVLFVVVISMMGGRSSQTETVSADTPHTTVSRPIVPVRSSRFQDSQPSPSDGESSTARAGSVAALSSLVAKMRAAGATDEQIADFVNAALDQLWSEEQRGLQRKARRGEIDPRTAWQMSPERQAAREQAMRDLVGDVAFANWDKKNVFRWFDIESLGLSAVETDALYIFQKEQQRQGLDLNQAMQAGEIDSGDYQARQVEQMKESERRMAELIGPQRAAKLKQESDWTFGRLRWDLRELNLSDAQVDGLFRATQQTTEKQQELQRLSQAGTPVDGNRWQAIQAEQDQEYQRVLGASGYASYKKMQDNTYKQMKQYAKAWQLNDSDIEYVYQTLQNNKQSLLDYRKQAQELQSQGQPVNWQEINQGVEDFKKQTEAELRSRMGEDRFNKLKRAGLIQIGY